MLVIDEYTIKDTREVMGNWCAKLRKMSKVSQIDLAEELAISHKTIANLESGKNFTIDTFLKVIKHYNKQELFNAFIADQLRKELETQDVSFY